MYRPKNHNNNYTDQKLWIKIDLREIRFYPNGNAIREHQCNRLELLLKYTSQDIAINFVNVVDNTKKVYEIRIPLIQLRGFRNVPNKHIEIELRKNFYRSYFVHLKSPNPSVSRIQKDPSGNLKDVERLIFTPCEKVHPMTIFMFEVGIKKWAPHINHLTVNTNQDDKHEMLIDEDLIIDDKPHNPTLPPSNNSNNISNPLPSININISNPPPSIDINISNPPPSINISNPPPSNNMSKPPNMSNPPPSNNISEYLVTCNFLTFTRSIRLPTKGSFKELLKGINRQLKCEIDSFNYRNNDGAIITVETDEDWSLAKMNFAKQKISSFDIYIST